MVLVKRMALATIILTMALISLGGIVHNTGSSLACPDWPTCYGTFFPKMEGGILIEHGHRLLGALVGLATIIIVFLSRKFPKLRAQSLVSLGLVTLQGLLGGLTVIYELPTIVSTLHLGLSMVYLLSLVRVWAHTHLPQAPPSSSWNPLIFHFFLAVMALLFGQILLGGLIRHSGAGPACGLGPEAMIWCPDFAQDPSPATTHLAHRFLGIIVLLASLASALLMRKNLAQAPSYLRVANLLAPLMILAQAILGAMTISSHLSVVPRTLHLTLPALTLVAMGAVANFGLSHFPGQHSLISDLLSLARPRLSLMVLLSSWAGLLLAPGEVSFFRALFGLGAIAAVVAAASALNGWLERHKDAQMERTKDRPLAQGRLPPRGVLWGGASLAVVSVGGLVLGLKAPIVGALSALSLGIYILLYTPMKTRSPLALAVGAIPGAIPPILGYLLVTPSLNMPVIGLFIMVLAWQFPHFFSISLYHQRDYNQAGMKTFTRMDDLRRNQKMMLVSVAVLVAVSLLPWWAQQRGNLYAWVAMALGALFFGNVLVMGPAPRAWARRMFFTSLAYLPLAMFSLVLLR